MTRLGWLLPLPLAIACNSSTSPKANPRTHPAGQIYHTDNLGVRVYAAAATNNGNVLFSLEDDAQIGRIVLPYVDTIALDPVTSIPADISLDASQTHAFVSDEAGQVVEVDLATGAHLATIQTTGAAFATVVSSDGNTLFISTNTNSVYAVPLSNPTTSTSIMVDNASGGAPNFMTLSPDGSILYVSTRTGGTVVAVDTRTFTATKTFTAGGLVQQAVVSPDGTTLYAVNENGNLYIWNTATGNLSDSVALGGQAWALAMTPDAEQLYVSLLDQGKVLVLDRTTLSTVMTINTGGIPRRIAFAQHGKVAVITDEAGFIHFVD